MKKESTGTWKEEIDAAFNMGLLIPYIVGYRCSKCKKLAKDTTDFCPHCGSPMKPFTESEDNDNE